LKRLCFKANGLSLNSAVRWHVQKFRFATDPEFIGRLMSLPHDHADVEAECVEIQLVLDAECKAGSTDVS
jgi:hypothetical protein